MATAWQGVVGGTGGTAYEGKPGQLVLPGPLTWFSAAAWFDPPTTSGVYRWLDVPTDQKWWHLAPGETRDGGDARVPTWASYPNDP